MHARGGCRPYRHYFYWQTTLYGVKFFIADLYERLITKKLIFFVRVAAKFIPSFRLLKKKLRHTVNNVLHGRAMVLSDRLPGSVSIDYITLANGDDTTAAHFFGRVARVLSCSGSLAHVWHLLAPGVGLGSSVPHDRSDKQTQGCAIRRWPVLIM